MIFQIKEKSGSILASITPFLTTDDKAASSLAIILSLAHSKNPDSRQIAAKLLGSLADQFGKNLIENYILHELLSLGTDSDIRVRI